MNSHVHPRLFTEPSCPYLLSHLFSTTGQVTSLFVYAFTDQMWSSAEAGQPSSSLLMLGGGSESEGEGGVKSQLEVSILGSQEEVELLTQQEH